MKWWWYSFIIDYFPSKCADWGIMNLIVLGLLDAFQSSLGTARIQNYIHMSCNTCNIVPTFIYHPARKSCGNGMDSRRWFQDGNSYDVWLLRRAIGSSGWRHHCHSELQTWRLWLSYHKWGNFLKKKLSSFIINRATNRWLLIKIL